MIKIKTNCNIFAFFSFYFKKNFCSVKCKNSFPFFLNVKKGNKVRGIKICSLIFFNFFFATLTVKCAICIKRSLTFNWMIFKGCKFKKEKKNEIPQLFYSALKPSIIPLSQTHHISFFLPFFFLLFFLNSFPRNFITQENEQKEGWIYKKRKKKIKLGMINCHHLKMVSQKIKKKRKNILSSFLI